MTPDVQRAVASFTSWASRRWHGVDADDIRQQAAVVALEAKTDDPAAVFTACRRRVGREACRWQSPVTVSSGGRSTALDFRSAPLHDSCATTRETPESLLAAAQLAARLETLTTAVLAAEQHAARGLPRFVREIGAEATRGRRYGMHVELAERYGITAVQVVYALGRYSRATARCQKVRALRAALVALKDEIRS